jgi:hypothetical protein
LSKRAKKISAININCRYSKINTGYSGIYHYRPSESEKIQKSEILLSTPIH